MSRYRGPLSTLFAAAIMLVLLISVFGCSKDDPSTPAVGFGDIEITMPADTPGAKWHLYGPGESFRHGDTDVVIEGIPSGQYTLIWTSVKDKTRPMPAKRTLKADATLSFHGEYQDKAPGSDFVFIDGADFIMGTDNGSRADSVHRDTTIFREIIAEEETMIVSIDTTVIDTFYFAAEITRDSDEARHRVNLSYGHFLGKTEITNQDFVDLGNIALAMGYCTASDTSLVDALDGSTAELMNFNFPDTPIEIEDGVLHLKKAEFANQPLIEATWYGAASYCDWLSLEEGVDKAYDHSDWSLVSTHYRLPTEAEWENACRAGTQTAFSSGPIANGSCIEPALESAGWFCGNAGGSSHDVGTKAANPWGLFDMHGNVWEWCHDYYGRYVVPDIPLDPDVPSGKPPRPLMFYEDEDLVPVDNPVGPDDGEHRVIRSGRWLLASSLCRSAGRMMGVPEYRGFHIGFRVAYQEAP